MLGTEYLCDNCRYLCMAAVAFFLHGLMMIVPATQMQLGSVCWKWAEVGPERHPEDWLKSCDFCRVHHLGKQPACLLHVVLLEPQETGWLVFKSICSWQQRMRQLGLLICGLKRCWMLLFFSDWVWLNQRAFALFPRLKCGVVVSSCILSAWSDIHKSFFYSRLIPLTIVLKPSVVWIFWHAW